MKFLKITHYKDSWFGLPQEKRTELQKETLHFLEKYQKLGKLLYRWGFANMRGAVSIWDFDSTELASRVELEYPLFSYVDTEEVPVFDNDAWVGVIKNSIAEQLTSNK
jgi:hypothetical protein